MSTHKYPENKGLNLPKVADDVLNWWKDEKVFERSITEREGNEPFVFFEGPPSANGMPGIHHVMARTIKDLFCRYQTLKGKQVKRKAGWDTHGLPVELSVEKELGITKEDIGKSISIEQYNQECRQNVMKYTDVWNNLTEKMGYWVDMENPYITYTPKYMESVWWLLKQLSEKGLLYKGYTIQPYSPMAGTGLSSHELNQPGCYRDVKDNSCVAQFRVVEKHQPKIKEVFNASHLAENVDVLAWTTTPWTLPSNTALTVGKNIKYALVKTYNQYTHQAILIVLAEPLLSKQLSGKYQKVESETELNYQSGDKKIPYLVINTCLGSDLLDIKYEQLLPYATPLEGAENAFRIIPGDFVTTEDGTGIVHTAPTFGADDAKVAKDAGVPAMLVADDQGNPVPLVDLRGRFTPHLNDPVYGLGGEYIKAEYLSEDEKETQLSVQQEKLKEIIPNLTQYLSVDERINLKLKLEGKAFKVEKYEHSYPHCWRTDKPVLYYPLDSWFIKSTAVKERLIDLNKTINWKPKATGTGRFGNWLENLNDWNLSRSRFWGIPLPIWRTEEGDEQIVIGSVKELFEQIEKSVEAGVMHSNPFADFEPDNMSNDNYAKIDLHRNIVDKIILVSASGKPMKRESDLIDVWFDSGAMPYAQWHYPFENKDLIEHNEAFPADFIAEGVDQTRGWFFTLHAIATMCFDSVAYKTVVSNGLVLDKNGQKMSKRLGNAIDPFTTLEKYGPDATRWYMITNAQPWDNLKFDLEGIAEVQRKFFGTIYNTYGFFALYANLDNFSYQEDEIPLNSRPEIDRWIISKLNSLIKQVDEAYADYEPTKAGRLISDFVQDDLSNWYVRLCRKRFWKGEYGPDKIAAYQTLYTCLESIAIIASPIAPFYTEQLFKNLNGVSKKNNADSVHLALFPKVNSGYIDSDLEGKMDIAQKVSSLVLALRKKEQIKVRQPLNKILVPILNPVFKERIAAVQDIILAEVNVKSLELLEETSGVITKKIKANFKALGPRFGKQMKQVANLIASFDQKQIGLLEAEQKMEIALEGSTITIEIGDVEITTEDIPGMLVATEGSLTVALDITLTDELVAEGIAREMVNRIQNIRKNSGLEVTDRITLEITAEAFVKDAIEQHKDYINSETLCNAIAFVNEPKQGAQQETEVYQSQEVWVSLNKAD
jgi:isoleucyl-tRNA synthetase